MTNFKAIIRTDAVYGDGKREKESRKIGAEKCQEISSFVCTEECWRLKEEERKRTRREHRDLAPVQIDLAAACTDSGKLSRKCEYPL